MLEAAPAVDEGDHRRGQQFTVLHDIDPAVGEAAFVTQPDDVELEILRRVTAGDEVRRNRPWRESRVSVRLAATKACAII